MSTVIVNNVNTHVQELNPGAPETVLMIHGMFGNIAQFYLTIAPHLAKKYRVVMYDIKSHGRSQNATFGYDLISLTNDMEALLNVLNIEAAHLLGFSYGALMALKFALRFPERTKKLVVIEAPPRPKHPLKHKGEYSFHDFLDFAFSLPEPVVKNFLRNKRQVEKTFKMYAFMHNETTFIDDMNNERDMSDEELQSVKHDTLLLYGTNSLCWPMAERLYKLLPNRIPLAKDGDHGFFMHQSNQVADDLINFFSNVNKPEVIL
jgi:esterase